MFCRALWQLDGDGDDSYHVICAAINVESRRTDAAVQGRAFGGHRPEHAAQRLPESTPWTAPRRQPNRSWTETAPS